MPVTASIDDYHAARHAAELRREARCLTRVTDTEEVSRYRDELDRPELTYRTWLAQTRYSVSPAEEREVILASAREALAELHRLTGQRDAMAAVADAEVTALVETGLSVTEVGRLLGMSKQRISQRLEAHRKRSHR